MTNFAAEILQYEKRLHDGCITEEMHWSPPLQRAYCENLGSVTAVFVKLSGNFLLGSIFVYRNRRWI